MKPENAISYHLNQFSLQDALLMIIRLPMSKFNSFHELLNYNSQYKELKVFCIEKLND